MDKDLNQQCDFCDDEVRKNQEIIRTDSTIIIYPRSPVIEENLMFMPLRHVERVSDLTDKEIVDLFQLINKAKKCLAKLYGISGFNLFVNDGKEAGQHVFHVHFHFFGRSKEENTSPFKILNNPDIYKKVKFSNNEIRERIEKIKKGF